MLSLALVVAFAGMARASYGSIIDWMDTALNPDLFVIAVAEHRDPDDAVSRVDGARRLRRLPGVERVQMVRDARIMFRQTPVMVVAIEWPASRETAHSRPVEGDADDMYRRGGRRSRG